MPKQSTKRSDKQLYLQQLRVNRKKTADNFFTTPSFKIFTAPYRFWPLYIEFARHSIIFATFFYDTR